MNYQHHNFAPYFTHRSEILQNTIARCTARQIASFFAACKEFYAGVFRCLSFGCDVATSGIYQIGPRTRDDTTSPVSSMRACGSSFGRFSLPMQVSSSRVLVLAMGGIVNDERAAVSQETYALPGLSGRAAAGRDPRSRIYDFWLKNWYGLGPTPRRML